MTVLAVCVAAALAGDLVRSAALVRSIPLRESLSQMHSCGGPWIYSSACAQPGVLDDADMCAVCRQWSSLDRVVAGRNRWRATPERISTVAATDGSDEKQPDAKAAAE